MNHKYKTAKHAKLKTLVHTAKAGLQNHSYDVNGKLYSIGRKTAQVSKKFAKRANTYAKQRPWALMGIAAGVAAFFGFILGRKSPY